VRELYGHADHQKVACDFLRAPRMAFYLQLGMAPSH